MFRWSSSAAVSQDCKLSLAEAVTPTPPPTRRKRLVPSWANLESTQREKRIRWHRHVLMHDHQRRFDNLEHSLAENSTIFSSMWAQSSWLAPPHAIIPQLLPKKVAKKVGERTVWHPAKEAENFDLIYRGIRGLGRRRPPVTQLQYSPSHERLGSTPTGPLCSATTRNVANPQRRERSNERRLPQTEPLQTQPTDKAPTSPTSGRTLLPTPALSTPQSPFNGVSWDRSSRKWRARVAFNKKCQTVGYFDDDREAAVRYDREMARIIQEDPVLCKQYRHFLQQSVQASGAHMGSQPRLPKINFPQLLACATFAEAYEASCRIQGRSGKLNGRG